MKRVLGILMVIGLVVSFSITYAAEMKIGYVDFEKVFNEFHRTKTEDKKLKKELEDKEKELEKKTTEISKMRDDLELLSDDARSKKEEEIKTKIKELNDIRTVAREDLIKERNEKWLEIYEEIKDVIAKFGKEKGYAFILDDKALIYKMEKDNLTENVIKILNKK